MSPRRTNRRWLIRLVGLAALLALGAAGIYLTLGAAIARRIVAGELERMGAEVTRLRVDRVSLRQLRISDLELGPGTWLTARSLTVTYDLGTLLGGRVRTLRVHDGVWTVRISDGGVDWGLPDRSGGGVADPAFDRLDLESCTLRLALEVATFDLEVQGAWELGTGPATAGLTLTPATGSVLKEPLEDVTLQLRDTGDGIGYEASARGGTWRARVFDGVLPPLRTLLGPQGSVQTQWSWEVAGQLPAGWRKALAARGIELDAGTSADAAGQGVATYRTGQGDAAWSIELPMIRANVSGDSLTHRPSRSRALDYEAQVSGSATIDASGAALLVEPNSTIAIDRLEAAPALRAADVRLNVGPLDDRPAVVVDWQRSGHPSRFALELTIEQALSLMGETFSGSVPAGRVSFQGNVSSNASSALQGDVAVKAEFTAQDPAHVAQLAFGEHAGDWRLGGTIGLDGRLTFAGGEVESGLDLRIADGFVASGTKEIEIAGIEGEIRLSRVWPPVTPDPQRLSFRDGRIGRLPLTGGEAHLALGADGTLAAERLHWRMGEYGEFRAAPFALRAQQPGFETEITAREVSLGPWLALLTDGRVRGEGSMRGSVRLGYDASRADRPIAFDAGLLEAHPASGWVRISADEKLRELLEASDPRFRDRQFTEDVGDRIVAALQDFAYSALRLRFIEADGHTLLRIEIAGKGRRGEEPIEIESLALNIRGFDEYWYLIVMLRKELGS